MDAITQLLKGQLGNELVEGLARKSGTTTEETNQVVQDALPALIQNLRQNAAQEDGAQQLWSALSNKHDGSVLDNISGFLNQGDTQDGNGILGHVLGSQRSGLENQLSLKTGVSSGKISTILAMLAPIVMGYLGKQSRQSQVQDGKGLGGLLGGLLSGSGGMGSMLDQNGDGKVDMKDLGGLMGGFLGKK
jgi:hypothetical protein